MNEASRSSMRQTIPTPHDRCRELCGHLCVRPRHSYWRPEPDANHCFALESILSRLHNNFVVRLSPLLSGPGFTLAVHRPSPATDAIRPTRVRNDAIAQPSRETPAGTCHWLAVFTGLRLASGRRHALSQSSPQNAISRRVTGSGD